MKDEDEVVGQKERGGGRFIQCNIHSLRWKQTKNKRILIFIRWLLQSCVDVVQFASIRIEVLCKFRTWLRKIQRK